VGLQHFDSLEIFGPNRLTIEQLHIVSEESTPLTTPRDPTPRMTTSGVLSPRVIITKLDT